jgi:plasmid maintenance system antidote protein VapI
MIYKDKIQGLLESLDMKLKVIQNISNGTMRLEPKEITAIIQDARKITERISELITIER